jgi:hypothetical protein
MRGCGDAFVKVGSGENRDSVAFGFILAGWASLDGGASWKIAGLKGQLMLESHRQNDLENCL